MTHKSAINLLEGYYGTYERELTKGMIYNYLEEEFTEGELEIIMDRVIKGYTGQFRFTPDIHIIEQFKDGYNEEQRNKVDGKTIGNRREGKKTYMIAKRPDGEQMEEVAQLLGKLTNKLKGGGEEP
ncbi:hypothetical protein ES705_16421 [subsurface metagenome]